MQGAFIRDVMKGNAKARNFRAFSPDEMASNRWNAVFEVTDRCSVAEIVRGDENVAPDGRVMEVLSEHLCEGWLEGYLLTGRHGFFSCYEAFIHIVDSMFNQHAKWLKVSREIPVARADRLAQHPAVLARMAPGSQRLLAPGPGLHRPRRQQEGGDDPRVPAAGREHAVCGDRHLPQQPPSRQCHRRGQAAGAAVAFARRRDPPLQAGIGIWDWASSGARRDPDVVMACCGDVPTLETLAAVSLLREQLPELRVRVVNVVDLMKLQPSPSIPTGSPTRRSTRCSRATGRSSSRSTAIRGSSTGSPTAGRTTTTCTSAATRRKARRPRRST